MSEEITRERELDENFTPEEERSKKNSYDWFLNTVKLYGNLNDLLTASDAVYVRALIRKIILENRQIKKRAEKLGDGEYEKKHRLFPPDEALARWVMWKYGIEPFDYFKDVDQENDANGVKNAWKKVFDEVAKKRMEQEDTFLSDRKY